MEMTEEHQIQLHCS